ncbi:MAG: zinc dependent phospholipase C family protein [Methylobacillus sp.]|jgi:hypothetical protein|nr:zinc dependent phospholipase C family protein [Methylobacillus sp.]
MRSLRNGKVRAMKLQRRHLLWLLWLPPLLLQSADAHAWGLLTHVYFAQWLLWTLPLADPDLRRAAQRFPELILAGACLPDLALMSPAFRDTHRWEHIRALLNGARNDEETAVALGYASHLLADVMAHNHFVPAHEALWFKKTLFTHMAGEWALDAHVATMTSCTPHALLTAHLPILAPVMARRFRCSLQRAERALWQLACGDRLLRSSRAPQMLYHAFRTIDRRVFHHFVYYVSQTQAMLEKIETVLDGGCLIWEPDPQHPHDLLRDLRESTLMQLKIRHPVPITLFHSTQITKNESAAIIAPSAAPASTSLG